MIHRLFFALLATLFVLSTALAAGLVSMQTARGAYLGTLKSHDAGPKGGPMNGYVEHQIVLQIWPKGALPDNGTQEFTYTGDTYPSYTACTDGITAAGGEFQKSLPGMFKVLRTHMGSFEHRIFCRPRYKA